MGVSLVSNMHYLASHATHGFFSPDRAQGYGPQGYGPRGWSPLHLISNHDDQHAYIVNTYTPSVWASEQVAYRSGNQSVTSTPMGSIVSHTIQYSSVACGGKQCSIQPGLNTHLCPLRVGPLRGNVRRGCPSISNRVWRPCA